MKSRLASFLSYDMVDEDDEDEENEENNNDRSDPQKSEDISGEELSFFSSY